MVLHLLGIAIFFSYCCRSCCYCCCFLFDITGLTFVSVLDGKTRLHVSLIIFRAYISITDRVIPDFLRNFFMQVNIIIYYLCNVLLVLDVLNALHCFCDSMYLRGGNEMPLSTNIQTKTNYLLMLSKLIFSR